MGGFDISGLNASALTEYTMKENQNANAQALKNKLEATSSKTSDEELMDACKGFEAYFMEQVFKEMQKSVDALKPEESDHSSTTLVNFFRDKTVQEICDNSVDTQSNGFAQMLYENLKRSYDIPEGTLEGNEETEPSESIQ